MQAGDVGWGAAAQVLLEFKAEVDVADTNDNTALHYAAGYGQADGVKLLLKQCAPEHRLPLSLAPHLQSCACTPKSLLMSVVLAGSVASITVPRPSDEHSAYDETACLTLTMRCSSCCSNADTEAKNKDGKTSLEVAELNAQVRRGGQLCQRPGSLWTVRQLGLRSRFGRCVVTLTVQKSLGSIRSVVILCRMTWWLNSEMQQAAQQTHLQLQQATEEPRRSRDCTLQSFLSLCFLLAWSVC